MSAPAADAKPHYAGHRERLRQRFLQAGPDALPDYELLELLLFTVIPQGDVKPLAKDLLARFGNLNGIFHATADELKTVRKIGDVAAASLKVVLAMHQRLLKTEIMQRPLLNNWPRLLDYLSAVMAQERTEHFRLLFLNKKNELIADEVQSSGTIDHTQAYPREILKRALELGASALVLVHNHPSGDPTPSRDDIAMTQTIKAAGAPFGITIHDHLIVAKDGITSLKTLGLL